MPSGMAGDIDPRHAGFEAWDSTGVLRNVKGEAIRRSPKETGWTIWWDGDPLRELLSPGRGPWRDYRRQTISSIDARPMGTASDDRPGAESIRGPREDRDELDTQSTLVTRGNADRQERFRRPFSQRPTRISNWNWQKEQAEVVSELTGVSMSRGPCLVGDLLGDWREELLLVSPDGKSLRLYTTTIPTDLRLTTLLDDPQYRLGLVWQNVVYNKPCYPSYFIGHGMRPPESSPRSLTRDEN